MTADEKKQQAYDKRMAERANAVHAAINRSNGVKAEWVRESLPDSEAWIAENPTKYEVLPNNYGDRFANARLVEIE